MLFRSEVVCFSFAYRNVTPEFRDTKHIVQTAGQFDIVSRNPFRVRILLALRKTGKQTDHYFVLTIRAASYLIIMCRRIIIGHNGRQCRVFRNDESRVHKILFRFVLFTNNIHPENERRFQCAKPLSVPPSMFRVKMSC